MRIIIVDDSERFRNQLKTLLTLMNFIEIISEADNVSEAIPLINKLKPDIIIIDLMLPDGKGIDIIKAIDPNIKAVKIIISNHSLKQYKTNKMHTGADYFLDKSFEINELPVILYKINDGRLKDEK